MPNNKQAEKRVRQDEKRRQGNKIVRTAMRTAIRNVVDAESSEAAQAAIPVANKRIDKAAKQNIIHENTAARYKSRVARVAKSK